MQDLAPNTFGDFLAGVFGPLAFAWLVLGYFQQGEELRQNTRALELQAEELRQSVEHQAEMVRVAKEQFQAEIAHVQQEQARLAEAAKPRLVLRAGSKSSLSGNRYRLGFEATNVGNLAAAVSFSVGAGEVSPSSMAKWERGFAQMLNWDVDDQVLRSGVPVDLLVTFMDANGISSEVRFLLHRVGEDNPLNWNAKLINAAGAFQEQNRSQ